MPPMDAAFGLGSKDFGPWSLGFGLCTLDSGLRTLDWGHWTLGLGLGSYGFGLWTRVLGLSTLESGLRTVDSGLRTLVSGLGLWTLDFGLGTQVLGIWTLEWGLWTLDSGLGTLDSGLKTLDCVLGSWDFVLGSWDFVLGSYEFGLGSYDFGLGSYDFKLGSQDRTAPKLYENVNATATMPALSQNARSLNANTYVATTDLAPSSSSCDLLLAAPPCQCSPNRGMRSPTISIGLAVVALTSLLNVVLAVVPVSTRLEFNTLIYKEEFSRMRDLYLQALLEMQEMPNDDRNSFFALRLASLEMQEMSNDDPDSFFAIACIQGEPTIPYRGVANLTNPYTDVSDPNRWYGYCDHHGVIFPTWHRPYVLTLEGALIKRAKAIAKQYKHAKSDWKEAARNLRSPY
eukprot:gene14958-21014_t